MNVDKLIQKIESEQKRGVEEAYSAEGLLRLQEVAKNYDGEYKLIWSHDLLKEIENRPPRPSFNTGVSSIDKAIGGFREQQLVTLSASTKHGKTAMALFLTECLEKLNPVMIPLEQSNEELVLQRKENGYSIPNFLSPRQLAARVTTEWIEHRIVEGIAKYNTKFVVIDHLGYIDDYGGDNTHKKENLAYRIGLVMKDLKNIAKRWNVVILLLVHISQHNESNPPSLEDIKNSSDIIQESDIVTMLWRQNEKKDKIRKYTNKALLSIQANRRTGRNENIGLEFNSKTGRYEEDNEFIRQLDEMAQLEEI